MRGTMKVATAFDKSEGAKASEVQVGTERGAQGDKEFLGEAFGTNLGDELKGNEPDKPTEA